MFDAIFTSDIQDTTAKPPIVQRLSNLVSRIEVIVLTQRDNVETVVDEIILHLSIPQE